MTIQSQHTRLHWEVNALAEVAAESDNQHSHKLATCAEIQALARKLWGDCVSVAHHGSTHSGASLRGSDLDVVLAGVRDVPEPDNPGGNGYLPQSREVVASYLDSLKKILTEETTLVDDIEIVRTARMPLLKAKLSGSGIELKATLSPLDVKDIPACQTAELVSKTFKELPHARKLLLILKALMRSPNCLSSLVGVHTGGVSSYTVTLMVLAFCKFQAAQLNVSNVDLGSLFLSFLQFYSEPSHFDVSRHAIDVVVPSGFAQKHEVQAHLDAGVQQEMANRLCALEPISRHDIGQNSYRIKQVFQVMGGLRAHLASMNPYLSAAEADIEALKIMSSPRSYRAAVTPQKSGTHGADTTITSTWVERYLPLLGTILDIASIIPVKQEAPSTSSPPKAPLPQHEYPPGAIFVPGYGAMTLGQVSILSAQEAPLMGTHGHFGPDAFPTLQESVSVEANKNPVQGARSSPRSPRSPSSQVHAHVHGIHGGNMHGPFPGHALYSVYTPHMVSERSVQASGKQGGHGGNGHMHGPMPRGGSVPSQHGNGGGHKRGDGRAQKTFHGRNNSFGSARDTGWGASHGLNNAERGKPAESKVQPGGRNSSPSKRRGKTSPISIERQRNNMDRTGSGAQLRDGSNSRRERDNVGIAARDEGNGAAASPDAVTTLDGAQICPEPSPEVPAEELRAADASPVTSAVAAGEEKPTREKALDKGFSRGTIDSTLRGCLGSGNNTVSTTSLSMRSAGTPCSSAVSPMMLSLSPHGVPIVGAESTPAPDPVARSAQTPEANISDSGSTCGAPKDCKDEHIESETTVTPSAAVAASKQSNALQQHRGGHGRGEGPRGGTGFAPGGDRRFNNIHNVPWGGGGSSRGGGRRFKGDRNGRGDNGGRDGSSMARSFNPGGGTGAFQGHQHHFNSIQGNGGRWAGPRNPHNTWNSYSGGSGQNSAQRGQIPPHAGPAGIQMVPVQLPLYPPYPNHNNTPYVAPYFVMQSPQTPQTHAAQPTAANASESSAQQSAAQTPRTPAAANSAQPLHAGSQPDDAKKVSAGATPTAEPAAAGAMAGVAAPSQLQVGGGASGIGKRTDSQQTAAGEPPQHPPQQLPAQPQQVGVQTMQHMMLVPSQGPPGQGAPSSGAPQPGQSHSWPTPVLHPTAMMQEHPGGPSFMPGAVMYVALPTHMQMPPGSHNMPHFRHHGRGGGGGGVHAQGGAPHREHHNGPRNINVKHRSGAGQGFDTGDGNGRGRGDGQGGRGSWHANGGRAAFGRGGNGGAMGGAPRRNGSFGRHMNGRWRGEQSQELRAPEATQG